MRTFTIGAFGVVATAVGISACAAINGTRPGDMTIPEHQEAAQEEARNADEAARRATVIGRGSENERYSAWRHRELAKEHAAAAEQRRQEVAATCSGVTASTPFSAMPLASVEPIREADVPPAKRQSRGYNPERLRGARIALAPGGVAAPDAAARAIECEAARVSAGLDRASPESPFAVRTAKAVVRVADTHLLVEVRGDDRGDAEEILKRAEALDRRPPRNGL